MPAWPWLRAISPDVTSSSGPPDTDSGRTFRGIHGESQTGAGIASYCLHSAGRSSSWSSDHRHRLWRYVGKLVIGLRRQHGHHYRYHEFRFISVVVRFVGFGSFELVGKLGVEQYGIYGYDRNDELRQLLEQLELNLV
jgi:hypothetical protein